MLNISKMFQTRKQMVIIVLLLHFILCTSSADSSLKDENDVQLLKFLFKLKSEENYDTLLILTNSNVTAESCVSDQVLKSVNTPTTVLGSANKCQLKPRKFNSNILVVHCMSESMEHPSFLVDLLYCLGDIRSSKIVFYWQRSQDTPTLREEVIALFKSCAENYLPNVIGIFQNCNHFYTYSIFPVFRIQAKQLHERGYRPNLGNMKKAALRTIPDSNEPRTIVYRDDCGQVHVTGYISQLVKGFAKKHNATLVFPFPTTPEKVVYFNVVSNLTHSGQLDVPMSLSSPVRFNSTMLMSTVIESSNLRVTLPESLVIRREIFLLILQSNFMLIVATLLLIFAALFTCITWKQWRGQQQHYCATYMSYIISILPGMLGQGMPLQLLSSGALMRFVQMFLFLTGIYISTTFTAYLKTYLISSPMNREIHTFDQLLESDMKVRVYFVENEIIPGYTGRMFWERIRSGFVVVYNFTEFQEQRFSYNPLYGYVVTNAMWFVFEQRQSRLRYPLYRVSEYMYIVQWNLLCIPLYEHSIYRDALNIYIGQIHQSGLYDHWRALSYQEMLDAKLIRPIREHYQREDIRPLTTNDYYWIWTIYGTGMVLSFFGWLLEQLCFRRGLRVF